MCPDVIARFYSLQKQLSIVTSLGGKNVKKEQQLDYYHASSLCRLYYLSEEVHTLSW